MTFKVNNKNEIDLRSLKKFPKNPVVYFLVNENLSYIGCTNNIRRRLMQHKGLKKGGARYTRSWRDHSKTRLVAFLYGFDSKNQALSYEYYAHQRHGTPQLKLPSACHHRLCRFLDPLFDDKFKNKLSLALVLDQNLKTEIQKQFPLVRVVTANEPNTEKKQ